MKKQAGATLIEALVSILVMSLGLLGIAGMQLNAIAYQKSSWSMHRVAEITNDIAEKIRANPTGANAGNYTYNSSYSTGSAATFTINNCHTSTTFCSIGQIASDDIANFVTKAQQILPGGSGQIAGTSATGFTVTVLFYDKEFVNPASGALLTSTTCTASTSGMDWRNCCPPTASVPAGVRCRNYLVTP